MNTAFRPFPTTARPASDAPRAAYDLAWLTAEGHPEWQTRMLPATPAVEAACASIARGALVETVNGHVAVEDLIPGMELVTVNGDVQRLNWIGARSYGEHLSDEQRVPLYRVSTGTFAYGAPQRDTVLAGPAAILIDNPACRRVIGQNQAFAPLSAFDDGINVSRITPRGEITVYNLALDAQEAIVVNGMGVESFHPGRNTMQFLNEDVIEDMARLFPHLTPATGFGPQRTPRLSITEARMLELF